MFNSRDVDVDVPVLHSMIAVSAMRPKRKIARAPASAETVIVSEVAEEMNGFPTWSFATFETA